jgi:hypothetical protein
MQISTSFRNGICLAFDYEVDREPSCSAVDKSAYNKFEGYRGRGETTLFQGDCRLLVATKR